MTGLAGARGRPFVPVKNGRVVLSARCEVIGKRIEGLSNAHAGAEIWV